MRDRIFKMRELFVAKLEKSGVDRDFSFLKRQNGMFSFSGLSKEVVHKLRDDYGIYTVDSGRFCMAAMNDKNIDYIASAVSEILKGP